MVIRYFDSGARKRVRVRLGSGKTNGGVWSAIETIPVTFDSFENRPQRIAIRKYQMEKCKTGFFSGKLAFCAG
jgi:hypothetical protein